MTGDGGLERQILDAHAEGALERLAALYGEAGQAAEARGLIDQACFFFTQGYVFALDAGDDALAGALKNKLIGHGREE